MGEEENEGKDVHPTATGEAVNAPVQETVRVQHVGTLHRGVPDALRGLAQE